ncbi:MAG TPA: LysR family transcriptional regulator substrate-binding protein, partial [Pseudonocardia sp.]|nr:LysR family transcriptional regulator substrate-binding protein [Pseudonocardia sp.]
GTGLRTVFDQACAAQGVEPVMALQASAPDAIADLATRGLAAAVLSESMAESYRDRLTAVTIDDVDTPAQLALVWKRTRNPAVREFLVHSRRAFTMPDRA